MPVKLQVASQLMSSMGMARLGGAASKMAKPIARSKGSNFAALENALLKKGVKKPSDAKKVAAGGPGRQFFNNQGGT